MDFKNVRHLREILVTDAQGRTTRKMQYSSQNTSHFRPNFVEVPFEDQERARELYLKWGGIRRPDLKIGTTVVIPNRGDGNPSTATGSVEGENKRYEYGRPK